MCYFGPLLKQLLTLGPPGMVVSTFGYVFNRILKGGGDSPSLPWGSPILPNGILRLPQLPPPLGHPPLKNPIKFLIPIFVFAKWCNLTNMFRLGWNHKLYPRHPGPPAEVRYDWTLNRCLKHAGRTHLWNLMIVGLTVREVCCENAHLQHVTACFHPWNLRWITKMMLSNRCFF